MLIKNFTLRYAMSFLEPYTILGVRGGKVLLYPHAVGPYELAPQAISAYPTISISKKGALLLI